MRRIAVSPTDRFGILVVARDVAPDFARQVGQRRKDPPGEQVPLDFGEPEFHLIQPGRVGRREMQVHVGMRDQKVRTACVLWVDRLSAIT